MSKIDDIVNDAEMTVTEKVKALENIRKNAQEHAEEIMKHLAEFEEITGIKTVKLQKIKHFSEDIRHTKEKVIGNYRWCQHCEAYYNKSTFKKFVTTRKPGYYYRCPQGHDVGLGSLDFTE